MNLKQSALIIAVFSSFSASAQEMSGFRTDNYNGVNGVFFNPANLGNSPYKIDVGFFGLNMMAANNALDFNFKTFSDFNADTGTINKMIGNGNANSMLLGVSMHLPSVLYTINKKTSVALTTRSRVLFGIHDFDGNLINSINSETQKSNFPFTLNNNTNMRINANVFAEIGASVGRVIIEDGNHFLKGGVTLKYIGGVANGYIQLDNLKATINADSSGNNVYATNSSGTIAIGTAGIDINNTNDALKFDFDASSLGADLGFVYEYRPENLSDKRNKYLFKISAAVLDMGAVRYTLNPQSAGAYTISIPSSQKFGLDTLQVKDINELKQVFDNNSNYFSKAAGYTSTYSVSLPTSLQLGGDVRAMNNIYVNINGQFALTQNEKKAYNPRIMNIVSICPRFEHKWASVYLPISISNLSGTTLGLGFRLGPLYAGSSSILSMATSKSKQADFYFGFRFGIKNKMNKDS